MAKIQSADISNKIENIFATKQRPRELITLMGGRTVERLLKKFQKEGIVEKVARQG